MHICVRGIDFVALDVGISVSENDRTIKNGKSRNTDNIGHTRHMPPTNKTQTYHKTQTLRKVSNTDPSKIGERIQVLAKGKWLWFFFFVISCVVLLDL